MNERALKRTEYCNMLYLKIKTMYYPLITCQQAMLEGRNANTYFLSNFCGFENFLESPIDDTVKTGRSDIKIEDRIEEK